MKVETLLHRQGGLCFYCRKRLPRHAASIEHIVPQVMDGAEGFNNLAACCKSMNSHLQGISPKHKIELLLNHWGGCPCPDPSLHNPTSQTMPVLFTDFDDPGDPCNARDPMKSVTSVDLPDDPHFLIDQPRGD